MEMTRERISFTFEPKDMLLSIQMAFSFERAAVACSILERISGLEPSSEERAAVACSILERISGLEPSPETTAPRYLKLVIAPN